ncbi:acyltransferase family protein [Luteimicrobium subarcticum]|uniref:Peptidoglycan/LPS O-acetylase OafA/YrhL n=1 Tax=Luteimicrobium subarcticum TaxID=620910 RepID=A0A2M8WT50_9MICO|nr:acyltransferase [Luteimicrobium subarcticum]PJI94127.1 peptidoglycan/LPS O-acetylase OafA/YrhL [Luteimicrobium subarcticum]
MVQPIGVAGESEAVSSRDASRYLVIDALRGVAAVSVLAFHLFYSGPQATLLHDGLPHWLTHGIEYGRSGVAIFFVLSGFVIALTTRRLGSRSRDALRFGARRQLRLDPPYWLMLAVVLLLGAMERLVPGLVYQSYSFAEVVENATYTQGFFGDPSILAVAWTLCLEVQFYLVVLLLVIVAGVLVGRTGAVPTPSLAPRQAWVRSGAWALGILSLLYADMGWSAGPWFIGAWWTFCLGATVCWFVKGDIGVVSLTVALGIALFAQTISVAQGFGDEWGGQWFALATAAVLVILFLVGRLGSRPWRWLLFLGSISYSLYLVHLPVIDVGMGALDKVLPQTLVGALVAVVVGAAAAMTVAVVLHRWVEVPAIRLSRSLTTGSREEIKARLRAYRWWPTARAARAASVGRDTGGT